MTHSVVPTLPGPVGFRNKQLWVQTTSNRQNHFPDLGNCLYSTYSPQRGIGDKCEKTRLTSGLPQHESLRKTSFEISL